MNDKVTYMDFNNDYEEICLNEELEFSADVFNYTYKLECQNHYIAALGQQKSCIGITITPCDPTSNRKYDKIIIIFREDMESKKPGYNKDTKLLTFNLTETAIVPITTALIQNKKLRIIYSERLGEDKPIAIIECWEYGSK
jgi:hypothetical protein